MLIGCLTVLYPLVEDVPVLSRKDLKIAYITTSMFCALWIGGETAPELGTEVQELSAWLWCPRLPLQQNLRGLGKRTYIIFVPSQWVSSWRSVVREGLSRRTARATAGAAGAEVARTAAAAAAATAPGPAPTM